MSDRFPWKRVAVVGTTGAGKTTVADRLSEVLGIPHVELDALYWGPEWTQRTDFLEQVTQAVSADAWVTDGNYSLVREIIWARAEAVVWLDYPLIVPLLRVTRRTVRRIRRSEVLFAGNREKWRNFLSRDSLFLWALKTHRRRRRGNLAAIAGHHYQHLHVIRLRSPRQTRQWLADVERSLS